MTGRIRIVLWCVIAVLLAPGAGDAGQRHRWWESGEVRTELGITDEQSAALGEIWEEAAPILESLMAALDEEEQILSDLIAEMNAEEWELGLQIDKVETARSAISKARILMLYHMRQELTPAQRTGLTHLMEKRRAAAGASPPG